MLESIVGGVSIFIVISLLAEAVWETIKMAIPRKLPDYIDRVGVMALAIFVCWGTGADLFAQVGLELPLWFGEVFSGILCSRGANFIHDKFSMVNKEREENYFWDL